MARPLRIEFPGAVYHVTSRGNERGAIFRDDGDWRCFLGILGRTVARWRWGVHAYCLMRNHYHLLVETPEANLSRGMRQLNGEYTQAFNRRHRRVGHLLQGRFKALLVERESHLLEVCRYVVLNPVRARSLRLASPKDWPWSSYRATAGLEAPLALLRADWILSRFGSDRRKAREGYRRFVADGMRVKGKPEEWAGLWIGSESFGERLRDLLGAKEQISEYPREQRRPDRPQLSSFLPPAVVEDQAERNEAIYRAYVEGRFSQREIGRHVGLHYVTVSGIVRAKERERRELERLGARTASY